MMDIDLIIDVSIESGLEVSNIGKPANFLSRPWSKEEEEYIRNNIGRLSYDEIAADLGRTRSAVKIRQLRKGLPAPSRRPGWLTGNQVANILGIDIHSVMRLQKYGCMPMEIIPGVKGILNMRSVTLFRWATRPNNWIYFKVKNIKDLHLQSLVAKAQEKWNDPWVSIGKASEMLGMTTDGQALNHRIHCGQLQEARWNGIWYLPLTLVNRLQGQIFPGKGSSKKLQSMRSRVITRADRWMLHAKNDLGWTYKQIADSMKNERWNHRTVRNRLTRLKKYEMEGK